MNRIGKTSPLGKENELRMNRIDQMRQKISSLEKENEQFREALKSIAKAPHPVRSANRSQLLSDIKDTAASALDGGGEQS